MNLDRLFARHIAETDSALADSPVPAFGGVRRLHRRRAAGWAFAATLLAVALPVFLGLQAISDEHPIADLPVIPEPSATTPAIPSETTVSTSVSGSDLAAVPSFVWTRIDDVDLRGGQELVISSISATPYGLMAGGNDGSDAVVWVSIDGLDWQRVPDEGGVFGAASSPFGEEGRRSVNGFASRGTRTVAVGAECGGGSGALEGCFAAAWFTDDGVTWLRASHDDGMLIAHGWEGQEVYPGGRGMAGAATTDLGFVAVGDEVWTSPDGIDWEPQEMVGTQLYDIVATDEGLLLVGEDEGRAGVWRSQYGRVWAPSTVELGPDFEIGTATYRLSAVVDAGDTYVAVGAQSRDYGFDVAFWHSSDGDDWDLDMIGAWGLMEDVYGVTAIGSSLVAVGTEAHYGIAAVVWVSDDGGTTWVKSPDSEMALTRGYDSDIYPSGAYTVTTFDGLVVVGGHHEGNAAIWIGVQQP